MPRRTVLFIRENDTKVNKTASTNNTRLIFAINSSDETAMVSYTGQARFGEASGYFSRIEAIADPCADDILVEICQFNDEYSITFMQRFKDDAYAEAFVKEMRDNGVDASLI